MGGWLSAGSPVGLRLKREACWKVSDVGDESSSILGIFDWFEKSILCGYFKSFFAMSDYASITVNVS